MTDRTKFVLQGFIQLTNDEKIELVNQINGYYKSNSLGQEHFCESIHKSINSIVLGPLGEKCPCCGR